MGKLVFSVYLLCPPGDSLVPEGKLLWFYQNKNIQEVKTMNKPIEIWTIGNTYEPNQLWSYDYYPKALLLVVTILFLVGAGALAYIAEQLWHRARENYQIGKTLSFAVTTMGSILCVILIPVYLLAITGNSISIIGKDEAAVVFRSAKKLIVTPKDELVPVRVTKGITISEDLPRVVFTIPFVEGIKLFPLTAYELETPAFQLDTKGGATERHMYVTMQVMVTNPVKYTTSSQNPNKVIKKAALLVLNSITQNLTDDEIPEKNSEINRTLTSMLESIAAEYGMKILHAEYGEIPVRDYLSLPRRLEAFDHYF
jgi:hypothetical protein